jgi:AcrR family transcriptional regulator
MSARRRPGRPPRGEGEESRSRDLLLEAAMKVFAKRGYEKATVAEIVKEAGLSKGTFYWVFDSKQELFAALVEERIERPVEALMKMIRTAPVDIAMNPEVSAAMMGTLARERDLMLLVHEYQAAAIRDETLRTGYRKRLLALRELLATTFARRHEREGVPIGMPMDHVALACIALAEGLALQRMALPDVVGEEIFGEVAALMWDGQLYRAQQDRDG